MSQLVNDQAGHFHIAIKVCNGGYIVHAIAPDGSDPSDWPCTTSVFTDVSLMADYVKRVAIACEGCEAFQKLGPLQVQSE